MKLRKNHTTIVVNGKTYQYSVSLAAKVVSVYNEDDQKKLIPLSTPIPDKPKDRMPTWKGKHGDAGYGKYEVSEMIKAVGF